MPFLFRDTCQIWRDFVLLVLEYDPPSRQVGCVHSSGPASQSAVWLIGLPCHYGRAHRLTLHAILSTLHISRYFLQRPSQDSVQHVQHISCQLLIRSLHSHLWRQIISRYCTPALYDNFTFLYSHYCCFTLFVVDIMSHQPFLVITFLHVLTPSRPCWC